MFSRMGLFTLVPLLMLIMMALIRQSAAESSNGNLAETDMDVDMYNLPIPSGVTFIGIGYNIIEGNPEGGDPTTGGVDPGLLVTRQVFNFTYDEGKVTNDGKFRVPDEVKYVLRSSAVSSSSATTFHGTSSYQKKLSNHVEASGSANEIFVSVEFAGSSRYEQISDRTSSQGTVYYANETIRNLGSARYQTSLAEIDRYALDPEFVADACRLPSEYNEQEYMTFIDTWGTHIITKVDLGTREGENYEEQRTEFVSHASTSVGGSVSSGGSYLGFSSSLSVDMDTFNSGMESGDSFGSRFTSYKIGSESLNEPISLELTGMNDIFKADYWTLMSHYEESGYCAENWDRAMAGRNILEAMRGYAEWKEIQGSQDPEVRIPLTWPDGKYGLLKPVVGCPNTEFTWNEGSRDQDTEDNWADNGWSFYMPLVMDGVLDMNWIRQKFCIKTVSNVDERSHWQWQPGSYCIYKYGDSCPQAFTEGWIYWDDEDHGNDNAYSGTLPAGEYGGNTKEYFCCRSDGVTDHPIYLPTDDHFFLLSQFENCQQVDGMKVQAHFIKWDTEDHDTTDDMSSVHPYLGVRPNGKDIQLYYCYYNDYADLPPSFG